MKEWMSQRSAAPSGYQDSSGYADISTPDAVSLSPCLCHIPPCQNQANLNAPTRFLLDIGMCYLNHRHLPLRHLLRRPHPLSRGYLSLYETRFELLRILSGFGKNTCVDPLMIPMRSYLSKIYIAHRSPPIQVLLQLPLPTREG